MPALVRTFLVDCLSNGAVGTRDKLARSEGPTGSEQGSGVREPIEDHCTSACLCCGPISRHRS
jgi:hypothetical protein